jgi:hypothetical protein
VLEIKREVEKMFEFHKSPGTTMEEMVAQKMQKQMLEPW